MEKEQNGQNGTKCIRREVDDSCSLETDEEKTIDTCFRCMCGSQQRTHDHIVVVVSSAAIRFDRAMHLSDLFMRFKEDTEILFKMLDDIEIIKREEPREIPIS